MYSSVTQLPLYSASGIWSMKRLSWAPIQR